MPRLVNLKLRTEQAGWLVHPDLRTRMIDDAQEKGTNLSDLALQILAQHFRVSYSPNGRHSSPREDADQFNFRIPADLERVLAATFPGKINDGIRYTLCAHYGLRVPPKPKMTRNRSPRPATA